jgi:dTDP-4-amino-4,6-dideoxygalactose transaminase
MLPRHKLDMSWSALLVGLAACLFARRRVVQQVEARWSPLADTLACLSVRSGFDATLRALALPVGSEVLVSAITIRDMVRIIEQHGLVPVPVAVDWRTLAVHPESLRRALTPRTRAIVVAHLFGSRMPLDNIAQLAAQHSLYLFEDCAQSYAEDDYRGHPASDVSLFSFGPIKTATALGGALLRFKDRALLARVRAVQAGYPRQPRHHFAGRLAKYALLKGCSSRHTFWLFVALCRLWGTTHDQVIGQLVRGFAGGHLLERIRQQPCAPLLALLAYRLKRADPQRIWRRAALAQAAQAQLALLFPVARPGEAAAWHSHWVFPICSQQPDALMRHLWRHGFDATRGATSLYTVPPAGGTTAAATTEDASAAQGWLAQVLYVPIYEGVSLYEVRRMAALIAAFEQSAQAATAALAEKARC